MIDILFIAVFQHMLLQRVAGHGRLSFTKRRMASQYLELPTEFLHGIDKTSFDVIDLSSLKSALRVGKAIKNERSTVVAIDGKTMRGTDDENRVKELFILLVRGAVRTILLWDR